MAERPNAGQASPKNAEPDLAPRAGRCAIVGRPNVGKSTLLNTLLGQRLVIATPTPNTTRSAILGIYSAPEPATQIAFVDTPGWRRPKSELGRLLSNQAQQSLTGADVVLVVTDTVRATATQAIERDAEVLAALKAEGVPHILAINKVDLLRDKQQLLPLLTAYQEAAAFQAVVPISATTEVQLESLLTEIRKCLPEGLLYEDDQLTDRPERFFVAEFVREAVIMHTRDEVPHGVAVVIETFEEHSKHTSIRATLVVEKAAHKKMVIGSAGALIKTIGTDARKVIESFLQRKVFLELWVKVDPGWTRNAAKVRELVPGPEA